jgi:uncharacterized protein
MPAIGRRRRNELTAFVREVMLPGSGDGKPKLVRQHCRFRLDAGPSAIHRWGIFAAEAIPARRRVIEYIGQKIGPAEVERRSLRPLLYIFHLSNALAVDGAIGGSGAEYINHSCEPNLRATITRGHILLVSKQRIEPGEELTFDYHVSGDRAGPACRCGSSHCRGTLHQVERERV